MKDKKEREVEEKEVEEKPETDAKSKKCKKDPNLEKIEKLEKELEMWKDKAYRTVADCDNLRKSYEKDHQLMVKYRGQPFVEKLLPTLDSFYMVLKVTPEDQMLKNYLMGFNMIYTSMLSSLESEGVKQIIPNLNVEFDHNTMQAIDVREGEEDNKVVEVSKPGYFLRDRLIRPAMVVVSKIKKTEDETKVEETVEETNELNDEDVKSSNA